MLASKFGDSGAKYSIGWCYETGELGQLQDRDSALKWYRDADYPLSKTAIERIMENQ